MESTQPSIWGAINAAFRTVTSPPPGTILNAADTLRNVAGIIPSNQDTARAVVGTVRAINNARNVANDTFRSAVINTVTTPVHVFNRLFR